MKYYHDKTACFYKSFKNDLPHAYIYIYIYVYIDTVHTYYDTLLVIT